MIVQQDDGWKISESDTFFFKFCILFFKNFAYSVHSSSEYIEFTAAVYVEKLLNCKVFCSSNNNTYSKTVWAGGFMKLQFCFALF